MSGKMVSELSLIVGHPAAVGRELLVGVGTLPSTLEMGVKSFFLCSSLSFMMFMVFWLQTLWLPLPVTIIFKYHFNNLIFPPTWLITFLSSTVGMQKTWKLIHRHTCYRYHHSATGMPYRQASWYSLLCVIPFKNFTQCLFNTAYATLLSIFLTRGNFCFDKASIKNKSSVDNFIILKTGRIFQTSFWLRIFKTLLRLYFPDTSGYNRTSGPAPWCHVTGWVDTVDCRNIPGTIPSLGLLV